MSKVMGEDKMVNPYYTETMSIKYYRNKLEIVEMQADIAFDIMKTVFDDLDRNESFLILFDQIHRLSFISEYNKDKGKFLEAVINRYCDKEKLEYNGICRKATILAFRVAFKWNEVNLKLKKEYELHALPRSV